MADKLKNNSEKVLSDDEVRNVAMMIESRLNRTDFAWTLIIAKRDVQMPAVLCNVPLSAASRLMELGIISIAAMSIAGLDENDSRFNVKKN